MDFGGNVAFPKFQCFLHQMDNYDFSNLPLCKYNWVSATEIWNL